MRNKCLIVIFLIIISAFCAVGFAACDKETGSVDENYETWRDSDLAEDYNGDRRITEEDYEIYKGYKVWKNSDNAYDYNGDKKINFDDYIFLKDPETADFATWIVSDSVYDYNGDGITDETDFIYYNNYKCFIGKFKVVNFNCRQNDSYGTNRTIVLNDTYNLNDLAQDIGNFNFEVSKDLKLTCVYGDVVKQKLGEDENAVLNAINSCEFDKLSDTVTTATFTIQGLTFTVYLTTTENGFSSSINVTVRGISARITFDIIYVK